MQKVIIFINATMEDRRDLSLSLINQAMLTEGAASIFIDSSTPAETIESLAGIESQEIRVLVDGSEVDHRMLVLATELALYKGIESWPINSNGSRIEDNDSLINSINELVLNSYEKLAVISKPIELIQSQIFKERLFLFHENGIFYIYEGMAIPGDTPVEVKTNTTVDNPGDKPIVDEPASPEDTNSLKMECYNEDIGETVFLKMMTPGHIGLGRVISNEEDEPKYSYDIFVGGADTPYVLQTIDYVTNIGEPRAIPRDWQLQGIYDGMSLYSAGGWIDGPEINGAVEMLIDQADIVDGVLKEFALPISVAYTKIDMGEPITVGFPNKSLLKLRQVVRNIQEKRGDK